MHAAENEHVRVGERAVILMRKGVVIRLHAGFVTFESVHGRVVVADGGDIGFF